MNKVVENSRSLGKTFKNNGLKIMKNNEIME